MAIENTTYLITGATRGIGRSLVDILSARGDVRIIAGVRDAKHANAKALASKPNVTVVEIDSLRDETPAAAAKQLEAQGVRVVDVLIANAGIVADGPSSIADAPASQLRRLLDVNAVAPVLLFAAFKPFLQRSKDPRFLVTSSIVGSIAHQDRLFNSFESQDGKPAPKFGAYGASKTTANILTKRIALEEPWLTAIPFHPGVVSTDMAIQAFGAEAAQGLIESGTAITPEQSAAATIKLVESAKHDTHSGRFYDVQKDDFLEY